MKERSNERQIAICTPATVKSDLEESRRPVSVLLTAACEVGDYYDIGKWIQYFVEKGTVSFCCVGPYAENVHDLIDDLLYDLIDEYGQEKILSITTTFHDAEVQDAVEYFVHTSVISWQKNYNLVAFLGKETFFNNRLISEIDRV